MADDLQSVGSVLLKITEVLLEPAEEYDEPAFRGKSYKNKVYSLDSFSKENFWYDWVIEKGNYYNTGKVTINKGEIFTISPYHVLWPVPQYAIDANVNGVINQNKVYHGYDKSVPPLDALPKD